MLWFFLFLKIQLGSPFLPRYNTRLAEISSRTLGGLSRIPPSTYSKVFKAYAIIRLMALFIEICLEAIYGQGLAWWQQKPPFFLST